MLVRGKNAPLEDTIVPSMVDVVENRAGSAESNAPGIGALGVGGFGKDGIAG